MGLLERQPMVGQERPPDGDLGERPGGRVALLEEPRRHRPDDDLVGGNAAPSREGHSE